MLSDAVQATAVNDESYQFNVTMDIQDAVAAGRPITQDQQQRLDKFYREQQQQILESQQRATEDYKTAQANYDDRGMEKNARLLGENIAKSREIEQLRLKAYRASRGEFGDKGNDLFEGLASTPSSPKSQTAKEVPVKRVSVIYISQYAGQLRAAIESKFIDGANYKGLTCTLKLDLQRDGTLNSATVQGGDAKLCSAALTAVKQARLPPPPSDEVWQVFKNAPLDFKP